MKKYSKNASKSSKSPKRFWFIGAAIVLLIVAVFALEKTGRINLITDKKPVAKPPSAGSVNLSPPTKEEKQAANDQKEAAVKQQSSQNATPSTTPSQPSTAVKHAVKPIIVSAAAGDVRSFVPNITENGGTCTARFVNGAQSVSKSGSAFADAQNTVCTPITYSDTTAGPGWSVTITYQSTVSEGTSDASKLQ